jgi:hypothetical protein
MRVYGLGTAELHPAALQARPTSDRGRKSPDKSRRGGTGGTGRPKRFASGEMGGEGADLFRLGGRLVGSLELVLPLEHVSALQNYIRQRFKHGRHLTGVGKVRTSLGADHDEARPSSQCAL